MSLRRSPRRSAYAAYIVMAIGIGRAKRTQFNWAISSLAALVNVALNVILIPPYGIMGAAVATVAAYVVMFLAMTLVRAAGSSRSCKNGGAFIDVGARSAAARGPRSTSYRRRRPRLIYPLVLLPLASTCPRSRDDLLARFAR